MKYKVLSRWRLKNTTFLYRDVLVRNNLTNEKEMLELVYYLASNISKLITYNSLSKIIGVKNATTVKNYLDHLQSTYLVFLVNRYDFSLKRQIQSPKKVYFIDSAMTIELGFHFSENKEKLLENIFFLGLKRLGNEIYYHKNKYECDFIIKKKLTIINAFQVSLSLSDPETKEREIRGLMEALGLYKLRRGTIITGFEEDLLHIEDKKIEVFPIWKWLLNYPDSI